MNSAAHLGKWGAAVGLAVAVAGAVQAATDYNVFAANDLGMHCADLDYRVFSILPPFNVLHAQVVKKGSSTTEPQLLAPANSVSVEYFGVKDASGSINTASAGKTNFWDPLKARQAIQFGGKTQGNETYGPLYPGDLLNSNPALNPLPKDTGLAVPDLVLLEQGTIKLDTQSMPAHGAAGANTPQKFDRHDTDYPVFKAFSNGGPGAPNNLVLDWFAADGIPILPIDDAKKSNAYPLMRVQAKQGTTVLSTTDVVVPVASEANCQNCHLTKADSTKYGSYLSDTGNVGVAVDAASCVTDATTRATTCTTGGRHAFAPYSVASVAVDDTYSSNDPLNNVQNAAKLNILALHDAKHRTNLVNSTPVQCAECHYTPALDLAQQGPKGTAAAKDSGRQQLGHYSMSRVMHYFHGSVTVKSGTTSKALFPELPAPTAGATNVETRGTTKVSDILGKTCYQCHPGNKTQCQRGAMRSAGIVCQDCHGNAKQVGNDSSDTLRTATPPKMNFSKRTPWLVEPSCSSCHVGDANSAASLKTANPTWIFAGDGIRLLQAWAKGDANAKPIQRTAAQSRFAEKVKDVNGNTIKTLYRYSNDHGGMMCEGCHGSPHALWPNQNAAANDNVAATQLQGHTGTVIECTACHKSYTGDNLDGPHGMHWVAGQWVEGHEHVADGNKTACRACHGTKGEGTVLSVAAADRVLECKERGTGFNGVACTSEHQQITVKKGTKIGCAHCHENKAL